MPAYHFQIRKADHQNPDGTWDLHVHVYLGTKKGRKLLGRYRLPTLEPIFQREPELNQHEINALREWLSQPEQIRKLNNCLEDTIFDLNKVAEQIPDFGEIMTAGGETYINIRIPISRRIGQRR
jgi:hypothetical protein